MKVVVVPHDLNWKHSFESEAKLIAAALGDNVVAIHHIGSTAIPDIYANPSSTSSSRSEKFTESMVRARR